MKAYFGGLGITALLLLGSSVAYGRQRLVLVDDTGKVTAARQHLHVKVGDTVSWARSTAADKPWLVAFSDSPCAEGKEFGSSGAKICTISVACKATGDPGCKAYSYKSSTGPGAPMNDPDIIVDP